MQSRAVDTRVNLEVPENEVRGTVVGFIPTKIGFSYRFNEPPREFSLDPNTGEIKTNAALDREERDRYDLVILSSQPTYPIEVRISVLDTNDNPPEFPEPSIAVSFSESAAPGTRLLLDAATDRDIGVNSVTDDYQIVYGNLYDKFHLAVTTNPSGDVSYLHLETTGKLDREVSGSYILNISARDGGRPPKFGYLQVNVTVLDVNDNPPIFDHSDYIVSLNESVKPGTPVLQVMASDADLGENSRLTYFLSDHDTQFTVDPESGIISTTEHVSCPQQESCPNLRLGTSCPKSCVFTVYARDHGSPRQDGRTYVTVNLVDTNDHDPVIRFQYFPLTGVFATVDENAANSSVVAAIYVVDMDEGLNGATKIQIVSGNELGHFRLENTPSFDIVRVNGILDREEISKYNLTIMATDQGTPPRIAMAYLIIHVNDINDHEPVFEKSEYTAILSELTPIGTFVASIIATDEDSGVNAQISYDFVSGNLHQWFHIDSASGLVTTQAMLDREVQGSLELNISARDGGPNPKWAHCQLKITILDENDEAPKFAHDQINVTIREDAPTNTLVAMLTASDHDQGTNGSVTYSLPMSVHQKYQSTFALDTTTGQLTTKRKLDRESLSFYEIEVVARDQGVPMLSSTATVLLTIADINDNDPEFYPRHYFVAVPDDAQPGISLLRILATDRDAPENAIISFAIESGDESLFSIDQHTGLITLRTPFADSREPIQRITISATDNGARRSKRDAIVEVLKESTVEELEFDSLMGHEFKIEEDFGLADTAGTFLSREVGRVQLRRAQSDENIEYSIVEGDPNASFVIDSSIGTIRTAAQIDRETKLMYTLTVMARKGLAYGKTIVNISVTDLNDNAPAFVRDYEEVLLPENTAVGQEVHLFRARDKDAGINSRIAYSLIYNPDDQFSINATTGVLYLNKPVQAEPESVLMIEVAAKDKGFPPLSAKTSINIIIVDVNDHTPVFDHTSYETSLLESTQVNHRFFALTASDVDNGSNGQIRYEIVEGNAKNQFGIFPDGYIFVKKALDREEQDYYALSVVCVDEGEPSRSSSVPVIIHIIDENDNAPQFVNSTFTFEMFENEPANSFVGKLSATDLDIGRNAELIYSISYPVPNEEFTIDPRNGFIKTLRAFDRESLVRSQGHNTLTFEATVTDNGVHRLRDSVKVKINILDVNDNPPTFQRAPYKVQISEASPIGAQVIRLYTIDADDGLNGDVFYYVSEGNVDDRFSIDSTSGQITLSKSLDRELADNYQLIVVAHDAATKNRLSSKTTISIEVLDENDNEPVFAQSIAQIAVNETSAVGTELMKFHATDTDLGVNRIVLYGISAGNRRDTFHIDSTSGVLSLRKPLDYEETTIYTLNITATDSGSPALSSTILFNIHVVDENDNSPNFPNTAIVRQIREGIPIKTPIVTVTAEDPDSGINGKVNYSLINQEPKNLKRNFDINATTGVVFTVGEIDRETVDTYKLTILATDQALPVERRLSTEKIVTVIVEDINDNAPVFVSMKAAYLPTQLKGVKPRGGFPVMSVFARDVDSGTNGLVTYEVVSGDTEMFRLHRSSGSITMQLVPDHIEPKYQLALKATDEAVQSERKSSDAYVTLIARSNEAGPVFEKTDLIGSIYENEPISTSILTVAAQLDEGLEIEYYVINVTANNKQTDGLFDIDRKTGVLSSAFELDRESGAEQFEIEVCAIAAEGRPRTSTTKVSYRTAEKYI